MSETREKLPEIIVCQKHDIGLSIKYFSETLKNDLVYKQQIQS